MTKNKMLLFILLFCLLYFLLAWRRLDWAIMLLIAALPAYLIRFSILGLPSTLLEAMIWAIFLVWGITNWTRIKANLCESFKKDKRKIKIRYPFDWEIILLLFIALLAAGVAGFSNSSFGIWKAYFFEPALFFIVLLNVMKGEKARNKILWSLALSALAVSLLAIYQKITGQLINNLLWAAAATRRTVSFFGYPNAIGLYLGPIVLVMIGWLFSVIASDRREPCLPGGQGSNLTYSEPNQRLLRRYAPRNDILVTIFIGLTIILSILSIYFAKSKGALFGIAAGLVVFALLANKKIRWAVIIILILISAGIVSNQPARHQALKYLTLNDFSGQVRRAQWRETWQMLTAGRLLTGAGLANYQAVIANYHVPGVFIKDYNDPDAQRKLIFNAAYRTARWQPLEIYLYPHNIVLNFWSELGLAGLLLFIWIIGKFLVIGIYNLFGYWSLEFGNLATQKNKYIIIGLIGAVVVIVIHGLVDVSYFKNDLAVMFWLLVAMMSLINLEKNYGKNL